MPVSIGVSLQWRNDTLVVMMMNESRLNVGRTPGKEGGEDCTEDQMIASCNDVVYVHVDYLIEG